MGHDLCGRCGDFMVAEKVAEPPMAQALEKATKKKNIYIYIWEPQAQPRVAILCADTALCSCKCDKIEKLMVNLYRDPSNAGRVLSP